MPNSRRQGSCRGFTVDTMDVAKYPTDGSGDGVKRPGLHDLTGRLHWCGHGHNIYWKNIRIKELP